MKSREDIIEIDFTDQIKESQADEKAGYPPNCNDGYVEKDGKCIKEKAEAQYPGENCPRRKDGVPKKKKKKRATKRGEFRDKSGKLKKTKADYSELWERVNSK